MSGIMRLVVAVAISLLALGVPGSRADAASCGQAVGPFTQKSARIFQSNGRPYLPLGATVSGLEHPNWSTFAGSDIAEIDAAVAWCMNTVRLQVSEQHVNDPGFLAALRSEVRHAEALGLVVVINDNDEWDSPDTPMPTARTKRFWKIVAPIYKHDPHVVFDIFNEPRAHPGWACWHDGGRACVKAKGWRGIVGMNTLAKYVRGLAPNLLWIDGPGTQLDRATRTVSGGADPTVTSSLAIVKRWPIYGVRPMMYSIHHPNGPHTIANWRTQFAWLAEQRYAPVVDGEWTNFAANRGECWSDAPQKVPSFLRYLERLHIGMTVWQLHPVRGLTTSDLRVPTGFGPWSRWRCVDGYPHSAGVKIKAWYEKLN
jgi:hypothetical protein